MNNKHENQLCAKFISAILRPLLKRKGKTKLGNEKNKNSFVEEKKKSLLRCCPNVVLVIVVLMAAACFTIPQTYIDTHSSQH